MLIDSIEMDNCSQQGTLKASVRVEYAKTKSHYLKNSSFRHGMGWGFIAKHSKSILVEGNVWFDFRPVGVGVDYVEDMTLKGNFVSGIGMRDGDG